MTIFLMRNCLVSWLSVFWIRKFAFNTVQCLFGLFYYEFYINSKSVLDAVTRPYGAHFAFEITLLQAIMLTLLLVCSFSPRVHSIPRGPLFSRVFGFPKKLKRSRNSAVFLLRKGAEQQPSPLFTYSVVSTTRLVCDCAVFRR